MRVSITITVEVPGDIGALLKEHKNMSLDKLADKASCSRQHLTLLRSGQRNAISLPLLTRVEDALGVELGSTQAIDLMGQELESMRRKANGDCSGLGS